MWIYESNTGLLYRNDHLIGNGYSGHGEGLNSFKHEDKKGIGPIPIGLWRIGDSFNHPKKGTLCMRLFPVNHFAHMRDEFLIHGDNQEQNCSASKGCIVLDKKYRSMIAQSVDKDLIVIPGVKD